MRPQDPRVLRRRLRRRTRESRATRTENLRADEKRSRIVTSRPVTEPIWQPSPQRVAESNLQRFIAAQRSRLPRADYASLYEWSVSKPAEFWAAIWKFCAI